MRRRALRLAEIVALAVLAASLIAIATEPVRSHLIDHLPRAGGAR